MLSHSDYRQASVHRLVKLMQVLDPYAWQRMMESAALEATERQLMDDTNAIPQ